MQLKWGVNPQPADGWPADLTEYEVAYVRRYGGRPPRLMGWDGDDSVEDRLDGAAAIVRVAAGMGGETTKVQRRAKQDGVRLTTTLLVASILVVIAGGATFFGVSFLSHADSLRKQATEVMEPYEPMNHDK